MWALFSYLCLIGCVIGGGSKNKHCRDTHVKKRLDCFIKFYQLLHTRFGLMQLGGPMYSSKLRSITLCGYQGARDIKELCSMNMSA
jgi:hypothetical protein